MKRFICSGCSLLCDDIIVKTDGIYIDEIFGACLKGKERFDLVSSPNRILSPKIRQNSQLQKVPWEEALQNTVQLIKNSKKLLLYGFSNSSCEAQLKGLELAKLTNGFIDSNSSICQGKVLDSSIGTGMTLTTITEIINKADLIILASRPSLGKSSLALDIAKQAAISHKIPVGIFSLEMSKDQIVDRVIASTANVDLWRFRTGRLSSQGEDNDFSRIQQAMGILSEAPIYIDDAATSNILQMRAMARRLQADKGLGLIIVDYLQLVEPRNTAASIVQQMTEISRSLKALARELNIPVLALSQLSRAVEQRSPQIPRLSDLRETGAIEQDADVVLFIHREDKYRPDTARKNIAEIIIAKHRNGPLGKIELYFDEQKASFRSLEKFEKEESGESESEI